MSKRVRLISFILGLAVLGSFFPACTKTPALAATSYTAIIPAVLQSNSKPKLSVALFNGDAQASGTVQFSLLKDGKQLAHAQADIEGKGDIPLTIPDLSEGSYTLQVMGDGFTGSAQVTIQNNFLIFLETDKPIYKPGQTVHIRVLTLDSSLKPISQNATVEILDAKGIKIIRQDAQTDDYGMGTLDLPLSDEPNLGTWKINASSAQAKTELDVRVEEYVLPKYEVTVDLPKQWFLVNEPIKGKVNAEYTFGKPVVGTLEITASKYVGTWQTYATLELDMNGSADFTLPAANYVAGVPAAGGNGNLKIEYSVVEKSTGYEEKSDSLLTVAQSSLNLQIIPAGSTFKPGLPFNMLLICQTPDNQIADATIQAQIVYLDNGYKQIRTESKSLSTQKGKVMLELSPPADAAALTVNCTAGNASASKSVEAAYSPSGNFIHLEQTSEGAADVGQPVKFWVYSTSEAVNFYYEVIAGSSVVFSDYTKGHEISFQTTPAMAPSAKLLVYQVLPNAEVAADYLPFAVNASYPEAVSVTTSSSDPKPGDTLNINVQTNGPARVALAAVDKSVFILAENRMNLQQVFDELENLYMNPQAEIHEVNLLTAIHTFGAADVFKDAGVIVLSNKTVPQGQQYKNPQAIRFGGGIAMGGLLEGDAKGALPPAAFPAPATSAAANLSQAPAGATLAEVQRVRQFFPETWIWDTLNTNNQGLGSLKVTVPDSITTWMLRAVAVSKANGLGVAEGQLKVFQPFFLSVDLPYSAIRGEEFPVKVAIYNYLDQSQTVQVDIEKDSWFDLLDQSQKSITIAANDIGSAEFNIRPVKLGSNGVKVSARSAAAADALVKNLIIEPEGVAQENVMNISLSDGKTQDISTLIPDLAIDGSGRMYLTVTSSYLAQTIDGLDNLLQMPFGCGEQNMILFAPDIYITKYLQQSGQLKPEIMAKAEKLMLTGYQRELTYMRKDGSFSAFGESDPEGSLWLTAFVLRSFADAKGLIYIDDAVLARAGAWIVSHQNADGSFDQVGFVHHQEMLGGLKGKTALTAYVAIALLRSGETAAAAKSVACLENQLAGSDDPYTVALIAYALELAKSAKSNLAHDQLMKLAIEDENGLHWGSDILPVAPLSPQPGLRMMPIQPGPQTSSIENTAYATLALTAHGDSSSAARAAKWLVSKRNAYGGYGSTQDTVVSLQALTEFASGSRADVNLSVKVQTGSETKTLTINSGNFDVLQVLELPLNGTSRISVSGKGEAIAQVVQRYNLPQAEVPVDEPLKINVSYDSTQVAVNDLVKVSVDLSYNPTQPIEAGMTVVDISVPTGFSALQDSIDQMVSRQELIKRYDISGRKVIFYVDNLKPGDRLSFSFMVQALYPVKAKGVVSQAYSYYQPQLKGESLGQDVTVVSR
jgi:CD109 antigen